MSSPHAPPLFQEIWTPSTQKSLDVAAHAACDLLQKLLTLAEEGEGFKQVLKQGLSSIAHDEDARLRIMKTCLGILSLDEFGAYDAIQRRNALLVLQEMPARGWQFTFTRTQIQDVMDALTHNVYAIHDLEQDILPEALTVLTDLGFPWNHKSEGLILAISMLKRCSNMTLARLATAFKKADIPLFPTEGPRAKREEGILNLLHFLLTRSNALETPYHDVCGQALIGLVVHTGGVPFLTTLKTFLENFHNTESQQEHGVIQYRHTFCAHMLQHCQRLCDEAALQCTLSSQEEHHITPFALLRRRV